MRCASGRFRNVALTGALLVFAASGAWAAEMQVSNLSGANIVVLCGPGDHGHEIARGHSLMIHVHPDPHGNVRCIAADRSGNWESSPVYQFEHPHGRRHWEVVDPGDRHHGHGWGAPPGGGDGAGQTAERPQGHRPVRTRV